MTSQTNPEAAALGVRRDCRGRFLRKMKMTPEGSLEWLIWSKYHNCWHRRGSTGGANGYTGDIDKAGRFDHAKASQYNSDRDTPFHVSEITGKSRSRIASLAQGGFATDGGKQAFTPSVAVGGCAGDSVNKSSMGPAQKGAGN